MGLFHKKEACPVCGGEVKGLFHKKSAARRLCARIALPRFLWQRSC